MRYMLTFGADINIIILLKLFFTKDHFIKEYDNDIYRTRDRIESIRRRLQKR